MSKVKSVNQTGILQTVSRAVAVLRAFDGGVRDLSLKELTEIIGLNKVTVLRLARTLVHEGLIIHDSKLGRYRLSLGCIGLARKLLECDGLVECALPHMEAARDHTDETICLIVREEWDRVALHTLPSTRNVRFVLEVGDRRPLHTGAAGTCLTMGLSEDERTQLLARVEDFDELGHNSVGVGEIRERQHLVRENGWAYARGEWSPEAAGAAAPIVDASGGVRGAISVVMPITRASNQYLETCARTAQITAQRTADELSRQHQ